MKIVRSNNGLYKNEVRFDFGEIDELMQNHFYTFVGDRFLMDKPALNLDAFITKE